MATTPCTLVIFTTDKYNFTSQEALIVMKQLFQYGVKDISLQGEKIFIKLAYSPKAKTLKRKFGNLPVKYMRAKLENEEEFNVLEKIVHKYKFNLNDEEDDDDDDDDEERLHIEGRKKKYLKSPQLHTDKEEESASPTKRKRKVQGKGESSRKRSMLSEEEEYNNFSQHLDLLE